MAFTSPESDLDSFLDGQLISSAWKGTSCYPTLPETNQGLYPAWLPLLQILISFPIRTFHFLLWSPTPPPPTPPSPPPPPPPRYVGFFNRRFTFFLREVDKIWLLEQVFWRALTKKKMVNPNPNPPHPPPPPRYGRWFTFFLREGLWQKHMALDSSHLNERRDMCAAKNWNIPSLGPYHWFPSLINH